MKLSTETLNILKNFASIQPNIMFMPGNTLKTVSQAKNILGYCEITETVDTEFGIYDLNEFLSVVSLFGDPDIAISPDGKFAKITKDRSSVKYFFSDPQILTVPTKDIKMPETEVNFTLTVDDMNSIRRASSALGKSDVVITKASDGFVSISVTDIKDGTSNAFSLEIAANGLPDADFSLVFNINNFKFVTSDYDVQISSKLISNFKSTTLPLEYFVALEKTSTFK